MPISWSDCSEIVCGKVIKGEYSSNAVRPDIFMPPYDEIIKAIKGGIIEVEELIEQCGLAPVQSALDSIKDINGLGEANWIAMLERSYAQYEVGVRMEKDGRKLQRGEDIDWSILKSYEQKALAGIGGDFVPLSRIEPREVPFIKSGWSILDEHLGGIPEVGIIIVGGEPGTGKTTFMGGLAEKFAELYVDKKVAIFSLEMILSEIAMRIREVGNVPDSVADRILLNESTVTPEELANKAATIDNLGLICIDFVDWMVKENSEAEYSRMYITLANLSKQLHVPIVALAQLVKYSGGLPKKNHLRYTRMAEAVAWMILMLYDPSTDWNSSENDGNLPVKNGAAYVLCWKVRGGFRKHLDEAPGAILVAFRADKGWGNKSKWFSLKKS